jgi:hypothetical protein
MPTASRGHGTNAPVATGKRDMIRLMAKITTAQLLAEKALQKPCGQHCVDWAIGMLEEGRDGHNLTMLAGMLPPYNHFEIAALRDRALRELGIADIDREHAERTYASECLRLGLAGESNLLEAVSEIKDLCIANNYQKDIFDFYLLYFAYEDLECRGQQYYWPGANRDEIESIIRKRAEQFLANPCGKSQRPEWPKR